MALGMRQPLLRNAGGYIGVAVATAIATRVLPPLMAQAVGMARGAAGRDPFDLLAEDHQHLLTLLDQLAESDHDGVIGRTQRLLRLKRRLSAHAMAEENIIYPMLHEQGEAAGNAKKLYEEHAEIKIRLHALEEMPKDDSRWESHVRELRALIQSHAREEEDVEFPNLRARLNDKEIARLLGEVQREKALIL